MTDERFLFLNNLYPYFKMLDNINNNLLKLIKTNKENSPFQNEELFYIITSELMRLVPFKIKEKKIVLDTKSGILLLSDKIDYIEDKYNKIINKDEYFDILNDLHMIRNKYIHEPHNINCAFEVGGTSTCSMGLYYKNNLLNISTISLSAIVYYLNIIFDEIRSDAIDLISDANEVKDYPYYKTLLSYDFDKEKFGSYLLPDYFIIGFN